MPRELMIKKAPQGPLHHPGTEVGALRIALNVLPAWEDGAQNIQNTDLQTISDFDRFLTSEFMN